MHIIRYYRGLSSSTYDDIGDENKIWDFNENEPLVGIYGNFNDNGVQKLSFISLDLACQAAIPDPSTSTDDEPRDVDLTNDEGDLLPSKRNATKIVSEVYDALFFNRLTGRYLNAT